MLEFDAGAAAVGGEPDLDGAGAAGQAVGAGVAPADMGDNGREDLAAAQRGRSLLQ